MASGLPVIATSWSGPAYYLDPADGLPLDYRLVAAPGPVAPGVRFDGLWAELDVAHLPRLYIDVRDPRRRDPREEARARARRRGGLLLGTASAALALPPNPVRQAAQLHEAECANPQGRSTHGAYVSFVARGYPVDPIWSAGDSFQD